MSETAALARWLIALEVAGWGLYPLLFFAVPGLRDRGLTLAKPFAILALVYPAWVLASLGLPAFAAPVLLATLLVLSAIGWGLAPGPLPFLRAGWRYVLAAEALFVVAFLGYAWLRGFNPQIVGTEKPMEIGFLSAATRERTMPPSDPWLSGYGINYYYLGYAIVAAVAKLTGVSSSVAFNLGLATIFAATLTGGSGLTANLLARSGAKDTAVPRVRGLGAGLLGGYLLALSGNMYAARDILERGRAAIDVWWWGGLGWKSSRVVIDRNFPPGLFGPNAQPSETINEFPFFSFILGDLHAHVLALPFTVLALGFALDVWLVPLAREGGRGPADGQGSRRRAILPGGGTTLRLGLAALVVGALYTLNSWDLPTYAALYLAAILLPPLLQGRPIARREWLAAAAFGALCIALYAPFYAHFTSFVGGQPFDLPERWRAVPGLSRLSAVLGLVIWGKTPADQFFTVYLLPWTIGLIFLTWRWRRTRPGAGWQTPALAVLALALGATLLQMPVCFFAGLAILLAGATLWRGGERATDGFAALLFGGAFALVLGTEVFFVQDIFGNRMNTVFKVYYQAWTLLAIAAGYATWRVVSVSRRRHAADLWRLPAAGAVVLLLIASTAYPLVASRARTERFAERQGLDGLTFVRQQQPEEWEGIRWVRDHVPAGAVVAEAPGCSYGELHGLPHDRVSAFAGVSTPIGWRGHEQQWRGGSPAILDSLGSRVNDLNQLYRTTDPAQVAAILDRYQIEWVYVGVFERVGYGAGGIGADCVEGGAYPPAGLAKFDELMDRVFQSDRGLVNVYRRR